ncbi:hypothetical protein ZHAS_00015448 [Anopheles sinensis]|uniref:Uncharacterized protein n=1 Tax=Anopheles sinensis TaxID=74873 RepID=A0A084WAU6_ANOSI|nr:hypothetical protein ZHAS_00015448 [Anopheles sinensis]
MPLSGVHPRDQDITSGGIQQSQPIDGYKSFLETSTAHLSAYVAAASIASSAQGGSVGSSTSHHQQQQQQQQHVQPQSLVQAGKWEDPYFDDTTPRNVTALVGKSAYLSCRVKNLANKTYYRPRIPQSASEVPRFHRTEGVPTGGDGSFRCFEPPSEPLSGSLGDKREDYNVTTPNSIWLVGKLS